MRLTDSQLIIIRKLIKNGSSLNYISKELGVGKTTIYYYFRKTKGRTFEPPVIKFVSDRELGEVVGIFTGDGSQSFDPKGYHYQNRVHFGTHNKNYLIYVKDLYERCFGKKFFITRDGPTKLILVTNSKDIFNFFHRYINFDSHDKSNTAYLKINYRKNKDFVLGFLKGLLDTDGTLCISKNGMRISYYTSSDKLAKQISAFLNLFKIKNNVSKSKKGNNCVYLFVNEHRKFLKLVKPFRARGLTE
ncbi:MAG: LAGLIDADG family homing endonuclease [Candidatus Aenigmatarchaeota archaeon]